ncbi:DNA recombination protein RmuC [Sphingobacterium sp.]|uniref:DNA recombination protein RmuC n=1 Tax=Sphingobacterium sp. TaxID=341027 RepID=UPI00289FEA8C|nr:DNA recombination protein RmuC [Sphingobacterium sp.]
MEAISIAIGFLVGGIVIYIIIHLLNRTKYVLKTAYDELSSKYNETTTHLRVYEEKMTTFRMKNEELLDKVRLKENEAIQFQTKSTSLETQLTNSENRIVELSHRLTNELETNIVRQDEINNHKQKISELNAINSAITETLSKQNDINHKQTEQIDSLQSKLNELTAQVSKLTAYNTTISEKLTTQKAEVEDLQRTAHLQFEKIANKLFEEKSSKFTETNKSNIETLLIPLKEDINKFKAKIEETHTEDTKQRSTLEERIKGLIDQTNIVSSEANSLASALKGNSQKRGNWGEMILERILESSGLTKNREYFVQQSMKDKEGNSLRPDVKVVLPDERAIMIDSKVSLVAYNQYTASENVDEQSKYLIEHIKSIKRHIDGLNNKKYDDVEEKSLDFTMMFVPIEPAYLIAIQGESDLWSFAYEKRILLVSPTTLIACLKLFSDLWRREWQNKNAMEIVERGESLYNKFVGFTESFEAIGKKLKDAQSSYDTALGRLKDGKGNLIDKAISLKNLGLKSEKKVPESLMPINFEEDMQLEEEN